MDVRIAERSLNGRSRWLVTNGFKGKREGYRAIVLDEFGHIRNVDRVDRDGADVKKSTHQIAYDNDCVLVRFNGDEWVTAYTLENGVLVKASEQTRRSLLRNTPLILEEWLEDDEPGTSYLPAGYGWDGERTGSEISKFERCEKFFLRSRVPVEIRDEVKPYILESRSGNLMTSWKKAYPLPRILTPGSIWVLWTTNNRPIIIRATRDYPPPYNLEKAMRVAINYSKYEVSWDLYLGNKR